MKKYINPVCKFSNSKENNLSIISNSNPDCQDKIIEKLADYSECDSYRDFIKDLNSQDILIGAITDIEEL